jgi:hypothetical protein
LKEKDRALSCFSSQLELTGTLRLAHFFGSLFLSSIFDNAVFEFARLG